MSDEIAALIRGTAQRVVLYYRRRDRKLLLVACLGVAMSAFKAAREFEWLGIVGILGLAVTMFAVLTATQKLSAVRLRADFRDPSAFAVAFSPLDFPGYKRFSVKEQRARSYRALLVLDGARLTFLPDEKGRRKGRKDFSVPLAEIRAVVVIRPKGSPPGTVAFVGLESDRVLHFKVLDRGVAFVAALRAAGVAVLDENPSDSAQR